ncbi:MAG: acyl-CoA thioesterase [Verrucomicrobiales bacterium]|nr:acyl-CoA thioesterase [Verrucomicrobiales bacterium]
MPFEFKLVRRVEFSETDAAGIVHFSNFFRYMEAVEHAFIRSLGFSVKLDQHDPPLGFPRIHADCDYRAPLRFEEEFEAGLLVREKRTRSLGYDIRFRRVGGGEVARGNLVVVCVAHRPDGSLAPTPIPGELARLIEVAPADRLGSGPGP